MVLMSLGVDRNRFNNGSVMQGLCISCTGMELFQSLHKFRVRVWKSYRTHKTCG